MTRRTTVRWIRLANLALIAVLLVGAAWMAWQVVAIAFPAPDPLCERLHCVDGFPGLALAVLVPVLMVWLVLVGAQVVLTLGPTIRPVLALLAVSDLLWILAAALGLRQAADYGSGADPARVFAWVVIALAATATLSCIVGFRARSE